MKNVMKVIIALSIVSNLACHSNMASAQALSESLDVSLTCGKTSPLLGKTFELQSRAHNVSGTVEVLDDCTISIRNFNYDGQGRFVEIYSAVKGDFSGGQSLSKDLLRPAMPYENAEMKLRLPQALTVDTIEGVSIWCSDVGVSFGDVLFSTN